MRVRGRRWFGSIMIAAILAAGGFGLMTAAHSAPAARPDRFIKNKADRPGHGPWAFVASGDTQGYHAKIARKRWVEYQANGGLCRPEWAFCPAWRRKVYARVADLLNHDKVALAVSSGDLVHCGYCPADWVLFKKIFWSRLIRKNRFWSAIGNHETPYTFKDWPTLSCTRPCLKGFHKQFPRLGCRHYYWTTHRNAAFAFMCTGGGRMGMPEASYQCRVSPAAGQVAWLRRVAAWVAAHRRFDHLFVIWHIPPFTCSGNRVTDTARKYGQTVLDLARRYRARGLRFTVLNGHQHVTEVFRIQGVLFMVNGGGGGPQKRPYRTCRCGRRLGARLIGPARNRWCFLKGKQSVRPVTVNFLEFRVKGRRLDLVEHRLEDPRRPERGFRVIPWGRL